MKIKIWLLLLILGFTFVSCEKENLGSENIKDNKTVQETPKDDRVVDGLLIDILDIKRINENIIGIELKLENKSDDSKYGSMFSALETESKKVLDQHYEFEDEELASKDITNLDELPSSGIWSGYIFFKSKVDKVTLIYDNMFTKKSYNLEIAK